MLCQGSFLFIFYFVLNEEVRKFWREKKRKHRLKTSTEKGLNLVNLVIGKDEDYDETLDETFETSDKEDFNKYEKVKKPKKPKTMKSQKTCSSDQTEKKGRQPMVSSSKDRIFIEPQEWERNVTRSHSIVDISMNNQEKITVL